MPFQFEVPFFLNCSAVTFVLCHAMLCCATVNLWALTLFTRMLPYTVVPPPPTHQLPPSCFCLDVIVILGLVLFILGAYACRFIPLCADHT